MKMDDIADVLVEYAKEGKEVDLAFCKKVISIVKKEKDLESYIKSVYPVVIDQNKTNHQSDCSIMGYDDILKKIKIDIHKIEELYPALKKHTHPNYNELEENLFIELHFLQCLLHEAEHARQSKISSMHSTDLESMLYKIFLFSNNQLLKRSYFEKVMASKKGIYFDPVLKKNVELSFKLALKYDNASIGERFANIYATEEVIQLIKQLERENINPNMEIYWKKNFLIQLLEGYDLNEEIISPTERYIDDYMDLDIVGNERLINSNLYDKIAKLRNEDVNTRLKYGVRISKEEYQLKKVLISKIKY